MFGDPRVVFPLVIFGVIAVVIIILSLRQSARVRADMAQFAASHGWVFLGGDPSERLKLNQILDQVDPSKNWRAEYIVLVGAPRESMYLFRYLASSKGGRRGGRTNEYRFACLAEHAGWRNEDSVSISSRVPLLEKLLPNRVDVGGPDFRREFSVECRRTDVAATVVNDSVQSILLEHAAGPQWYLEVRIVGGRILVTTAWAQKPEEWDYLITMTTRVRAALP